MRLLSLLSFMPMTMLTRLRQLESTGPAGNRWFKVNLHVHGENNDPEEIVRQARAHRIDLLAVTDHQTFAHYEAIAQAATAAGRVLTILPGIEITSHEGAHLLAVFSSEYSERQMTKFIGWLELRQEGDTNVASKKTADEVLRKVRDEGGIVIAPHPFTSKIGLLDSARKMSTKEDWLESGLVRLVQLSDDHMDKVNYIERDANNRWYNRYVLTSATPEQIAESTYCLAPFRRSDAHRVDEIPAGCSWFRMAEPSVAGLRQVAFEPRTRISLHEPGPGPSDRILGVFVRGGYCDDQFYTFNESFNCIIGQNYAGKSAVFDFIRFGLDLESSASDSRRLLDRLYGILQPGGAVEVYFQAGSLFFVAQRMFNPELITSGPDVKPADFGSSATYYKLSVDQSQLLPVDRPHFEVEVYEQGKIHRLRDDVDRQLAMIDEFAGTSGHLERRTKIIRRLQASANKLTPLYHEREMLTTEIGRYGDLETELREKRKLLPEEEVALWDRTASIIQDLVEVVDSLEESLPALASLDASTEVEDVSLEGLFGQVLPPLPKGSLVDDMPVKDWHKDVLLALEAISAKRQEIHNLVQALVAKSEPHRSTWKQISDTHDQQVKARLLDEGIQTPEEVIARVREIRDEIKSIRTKKKPRLNKVEEIVGAHEKERAELISELQRLHATISGHRTAKAQELSGQFEGQIQVKMSESKGVDDYTVALNSLVDRVSSTSQKISNRDQQLRLVVESITPLELAQALKKGGITVNEDGSERSLENSCGITANTSKVLQLIANDIELLNELETTVAEDVPKILVRRANEDEYADLRTGLSQGEQSAAILTLALQTRSGPLIIDQPEDELGYDFVVNLVVPKILAAKKKRQILAITHNANIPVLGDVDQTIRIENRPADNGRRCIISAAGCFESQDVTSALLQLEGGRQAFRFRQARYSLRGGADA